MILYQITGEVSSSVPIRESNNPPPTTSPEITERLQKLKILLSPVAIESIQRAGQWENLMKDISAVEVNPDEKNRFEQLYLNGYGQIVEFQGEKISVAEVQAKIGAMSPEERTKAINSMSETTADIYEAYIDATKPLIIAEKEKALKITEVTIKEEKAIDARIQAANQEEKVIDARIQAANQQAEKLVALNAKLAEPIGQIEGINGVPKPDINDLRKQAEANPPKELQGIDPVDIKSSKYDNILIANYYIRDAGNISKNLNPADQERFMKSISSMSNIIEGREDFGKLTKRIVLNSNREKVEQLGTNLINSGYSKDVIWNPRDRSITFRNAQGDTLVIDTAKIPPQLSKSLGNLSISRDIIALSKEDQEKLDKRNLAEKQFKSSQDILSQSRNEFWQVRRDEYALQGESKSDGTPATSLYSQYLGENRGNHTRYERLEQAYAQGEIRENDKVATLNEMKSISEDMFRENVSRGSTEDIVSINRTRITDMLDKRIRKLSILKESEESLARVDKKALEYTPVGGGTEQWEKDASSSLSILSELGLQEVEQQGLEKVMEAWNFANKSSNEYQIDLSKNPKIDDIQKKKFTDAIDTFTNGRNNRDISFVTLAKNLTNNNFISTHWNTPEKRALYLFGGENQKNPLT